MPMYLAKNYIFYVTLNFNFMNILHCSKGYLLRQELITNENQANTQSCQSLQKRNNSEFSKLVISTMKETIPKHVAQNNEKTEVLGLCSISRYVFRH